MRGVKQFEKKEKLDPRYVGSFQILEKFDLVAYKIALLEYFEDVYEIFHVSSLKKTFGKQESHLVDSGSIRLQPNLTYEDAPTHILD